MILHVIWVQNFEIKTVLDPFNFVDGFLWGEFSGCLMIDVAVKPIVIDGRRVGAGEPVFVIAEIGVNHDGSLRLAKELVELAAACGADAVKLQIFSADQLMHSSSQFAEYQQTRVNDADPAAMLRRYELAPAEIGELVALIRKRGLVPIATPFFTIGCGCDC